MSALTSVFETIQVGPLKLKNRFVMPPMSNNLCRPDGTLSPESIAYYRERARGGVGLIIVEASAVAFPRGLILERQPSVASRRVQPDWKRLAEVIHSCDAKVIVQIHHGGFLADPACNGGEKGLSPSGYDGDLWYPAREMTHEEVKEVINQHIEAAKMLCDAGLDGVEIHCCSTYLLNEFLTAHYNHRTDEYGGSLENRGRILVEIISGIKEACPGFMVGARLAIEDKETPDGLSLEDGVALAKMCEKAGADMINCSVGFFVSQHLDTESQWQDEGGRLYMAELVKKAMTTAKVAAVGKFRTPAFCDEVIRDGRTDLVCLGRQLVCDPYYVRKLEEGRENEIRFCMNCNDGCVNEALYRHGSIRCAINPCTGYETLYREHEVAKAAEPKTVVVVGGGVAGMQAAVIASKRGHKVILLEKADHIGGQMILAGTPYKKEAVMKAAKWFEAEVGRCAIDVRCGVEADAESVIAMEPDAVIVAAGAVPAVPGIKGIEAAVSAWDILADKSLYENCKTIAVIGGGDVGCETALMLLKEGHDVSVIEMREDICLDTEPMHRVFVEGCLKENAAIYTNAHVTEAGKNKVVFEKDGQTVTVEADLVVTACGACSNGGSLYEALKGKGFSVYRIGDAKEIGNIRLATRSAFEAAYAI